jgi:hypothetical protein
MLKTCKNRLVLCVLQELYVAFHEKCPVEFSEFAEQCPKHSICAGARGAHMSVGFNIT